jgi:hypothetical protein
MGIRIENYVYEYLRNPLNSDSPEMNVDGSTPVLFKWQVPATRTFNLARFNWVFTDTGMRNGQFGGMVGPLTNGLQLGVWDSSDTLIKDFTNGENIKANEEFAALAGVDNVISFSAGDDAIPIRFSVDKAASGKPAEIPGGFYVGCWVNDDIDAIEKLRCMVQGTYS